MSESESSSSGRVVQAVPQVGRSVSWHEPGWPSFQLQTPHWFAARRIVAAPVTRTGLAGERDRESWQMMRNVSQRLVSDAALTPGCAAFEVRIVAGSTGGNARPVEVYFTARSIHGVQPAETAVELAAAKLPPGFLTEVISPDFVGEAAPSEPATVVVELRRHEEVTVPQWEYIPADFYYTVADSAGDGSGWSDFWRTLHSSGKPVTVSILLVQTELHPVERGVMGSLLSDLTEIGQQRTDYDFLGNPALIPGCVNAQLAAQSWQERVRALQRPLLGRVAVRADVETAVTVGTAFATAVSASRSPEPIAPMFLEPATTPAQERQARFSLDWLEVLPWGGHPIWEDASAPQSLRRMPYLYGVSEASALLVLPVPDEQGALGIPRARASSEIRQQAGPSSSPAGDSVSLGRVVDEGRLGREMRLPLAAVNRHVLIVGAPGSGKTTTALTLLAELWREHRIPFTVIESVKTEYRSLVHVEGMHELAVYTLGNESVSPLRLNPLAPPSGVRRELHESALMASLKMAMPLLPPLPQILSTALSRTYDEAGWDDDTTPDDGIAPPTLRDLQRNFKTLFSGMGYRGDALNIGVAFDTRLDGLLAGSRGSLLDTVVSSDFGRILGLPCVIELNDVADNVDQSLLSAFVLERIRAAARARTGRGLQHVTVIEEAHRLLPRAGASSADADGDRTRTDSVRSFVHAIAELRSRGEGFILSSQSPSQLSESAVANCGTRVMHRLETSIDRETLLRDFGAGALFGEAASRLRVGEAVARWPQVDEAEFVQMVPGEGVDSAAEVSDVEIAERMSDHRAEVRQLLPFPMCTASVCSAGCVPRVRRRGEQLARSVSSRAAQEWTSAAGRGENPAERVAELLVSGTGTSEQVSYCAAVHLRLRGDAFGTRPGDDRRVVVVAAIRAALSRRGEAT